MRLAPIHGRVAQTAESQTERERSPFAARSSVRIGQNTALSSAFGPLRPGTGRAPALGQHAREEAHFCFFPDLRPPTSVLCAPSFSPNQTAPNRTKPHN